MSASNYSVGKLLTFAVVVVLIGVGFYFRGQLSLETLAAREQDLRAMVRDRPLLSLAIAFAVYFFVTALSLPGATVMTLLAAWLFGFWPALALVSFASTSGATGAFLLSRYLLGESLQQRFQAQLTRFNAALEQDGAFYLLLLRLNPVVPFFVVNAVMGLTKLPVATFWGASQLGMLPGTIVYVYAGSSVGELAVIAEKGVGGIMTPRLIGAFFALSLFPLLVRRLLPRNTDAAATK